MGTEYEHYLVPRNRDFLPSGAAVADLVTTLRRERWVIDKVGYARLARPPGAPLRKGAVVRQGEVIEPLPPRVTGAWIDERRALSDPNPMAHEIELFFPVQVNDLRFASFGDAELRYPFTVGSEDAKHRHTIAVRVADDFVMSGLSTAASTIDPRCACGASLDTGPVSAQRDVAYAIRGPRIRRVCDRCGARFAPEKRACQFENGWGKHCSFAGGATYRFGIRIDCGAAWPRTSGPLVLTPDLRALVERVLDTKFVDVGARY